jgi:hypothetical protein
MTVLDRVGGVVGGRMAGRQAGRQAGRRQHEYEDGKKSTLTLISLNQIANARPPERDGGGSRGRSRTLWLPGGLKTWQMSACVGSSACDVSLRCRSRVLLRFSCQPECDDEGEDKSEKEKEEREEEIEKRGFQKRQRSETEIRTAASAAGRDLEK